MSSYLCWADGIEYRQTFDGSHCAEVLVRGDQLRSCSPTLEVKGHRELDRVQCPQPLSNRVGADKHFGGGEMPAREEDDLKPSSGKFGEEESPQLVESCLIDCSGPNLRRENRLDLNQGKLGDYQPHFWNPCQRLHRFATGFGMEELGQRTGVNEVTGHLALIPLGSEIGVHRAGYPGQRPADCFQGDAVVGEWLEMRRRLESQVLFRRSIIHDDHADELMLVEPERFDGPQDAILVNSL